MGRWDIVRNMPNEANFFTSQPKFHYYAKNMDAIFLPEVDGFEDIKTVWIFNRY